MNRKDASLLIKITEPGSLNCRLRVKELPCDAGLSFTPNHLQSPNHGSSACSCKLSSSDSRCTSLYQHDQGTSCVVPVSSCPDFACGAYLHDLPVQCASFTFGAFLGHLYHRISYYGIAPFIHYVGWNSTCLLQCWGGGLLSHLFLGLPPPMLYSFGPAINYLTVHLIVTLFFQYFPDVCISSPNMMSVTNSNV